MRMKLSRVLKQCRGGRDMSGSVDNASIAASIPSLLEMLV